MGDETIKDLDVLLGRYLTEREIIKDARYAKLTEPGENYGSLMLKLDITVLHEDTKKENVLNLVAKTLPDTELYRRIFKVQTTFTNEMAFYDIIVPTLQKYQGEIGVKIIDSFPKCYGVRKNLMQGSDVIDDDAVLLLENLKLQDYAHADSKIGFDFDTIKLILSEIAEFHASFLALKLQQPDIFNKNILPYCENYEPPEESTASNTIYRQVFHELCKEDPECVKLILKVKFWGEVKMDPPREPFATVIHTDLWTHNTMQIFKNGKAVKNKFIDFQTFTYGSPASDVFFLLWITLSKSCLENHLDFLLEYYHQEFIRTLRKHSCDTTNFSFTEFLNELKLDAGYEVSHLLTILCIIFIAENTDVEQIVKTLSWEFKEKVRFIVKECRRRKWLY